MSFQPVEVPRDYDVTLEFASHEVTYAVRAINKKDAEHIARLCYFNETGVKADGAIANVFFAL